MYRSQLVIFSSITPVDDLLLTFKLVMIPILMLMVGHDLHFVCLVLCQVYPALIDPVLACRRALFFAKIKN